METPGKPARLFIAVPVTGGVKAKAAAVIAALADAGLAGRWAAPASLHLTLRFLGATPLDRVDAAARAVRTLEGAGRFDVVFDRLGSFPGVIWAGVGAGGEALAALAARLEAALAGESFPAEARSFKAHLTLGRGGGRPPELALDWRCPVERVVLYRSVLSAEGARHEPLAEARL